MLSAIDRIYCPPSNGMPVRHHRNPHITAEFVLIVFRINEHLGAIRDQGEGY